MSDGGKKSNHPNLWVVIVAIIVIALILICTLIGIIVYNCEGAFEILSNAATVASIVLSVIAMVLTIVSTISASNVNKETIQMLSEIKNGIDELTEKRRDLHEKEQSLKSAIEQSGIQKVQNNGVSMSQELKDALEDLELSLIHI